MWNLVKLLVWLLAVSGGGTVVKHFELAQLQMHSKERNPMMNPISLFKVLLIIVVCLLPAMMLAVVCCNDVHAADRYTWLQEGFVTPSDDNVVWCYYYWINDDISREGVTKDMEAMKEFGIGGVLIGNINPSLTDGRVPLFSDEWWDITIHAVNEGQRIGIEVGFFNCPGWSQSGGPWISHEEAMRHLVYSETYVQGPGTVNLMLENPVLISGNDDIAVDDSAVVEFQDTYVLAFKTIEAENRLLTNENASITSQPEVENPDFWLDGNSDTAALFDVSQTASYIIDIEADAPITARTVVIYPANPVFKCQIELRAKVNDEYQTLKKFTFDRSNTRVNVGPVTHGPVAISIPETISATYQLIVDEMTNAPGKAGFSRIEITEAQYLEEFVEKSLGKMHPTPLPDFDSYLWETQEELSSKELIISEVKDISQFMEQDGTLNWDVPDGNWTILRMGMTPTGTINAPAAPQGTGYEVDKANAELARYHFEQFIGEIIRRVPEDSLPALKYVIADSYEMGPQNWTDSFASKFEAKFGYDPVRYLPVFSGRIVGSVEESERFLWDLRRAVADDVAYEYVGGLREAANEYNLQLWLENYGHWGFPSEFLMYGGQSDLVAGEYWNEGSLGNIECKSASSAANIYGKPFVSVESWTASGQAYRRHPEMLKRRGDWSLTEGVNHYVLHVYIHQPDDDRVPGVNAWFSTEFNRHNTWFDQGKIWVDYLRRCQHLLQQPHYAADICYFIGEDAPKMSGIQNPELPDGYSFDYINAEVIVDHLFVKNGRLMLPHGMNYGLMVLPENNTMRPEVLEKIEELVLQGAAVLGPRPDRSPSLQNFPASDGAVKEIASRMWGNAYQDGKLVHRHGEGYVMDRLDLQEALDIVGITSDIDLGADVPVLWTHRTAPDLDIYFLTNQGNEKIHFAPSFRIEGKIPQLWDAVTGEIRQLNDYTELNGRTVIPISMEALQSWFVVFTDEVSEGISAGYAENFPETHPLLVLDNNWVVEFLNKDIGPVEQFEISQLSDWTESQDERIKYYSGTAIYKTTFTLSDIPDNGQIFLNLGDVGVMARATLNGNEIGGAWFAPYRIPVGNALISGENILEIEVVNTWRNRLVKDASLPAEERYTWIMVSDARPDEELQSSGLIGPVSIEWKK